MTGCQELPNGWVQSRVGHLFTIVGGGTPPTEDARFWNGNTPWITSADIDEHHRISPRRYITEEAIRESLTNMVPKGSIIIGTRVRVGSVGLAQGDISFNQDCQGLLFNPSAINPHFATYQLSLHARRFTQCARGTTITGITKNQLQDTPFLLAPANEQCRIVAKIEELFSHLDAGVVALERAKANLERYRAAVLKAAVEGRLTAGWRAKRPDVEAASELLKRILAERRRKWEEDQLAKYAAKGKTPPRNWKAKYKEPAKPDVEDLPALPEGWCWVTIGQIAQVQGGIQKSPKRIPKANSFPYLRVENVLRDELDLAQVSFFELFEGEIEKFRLEPGDLLVVEGNGSKREIGRSALWKGEIENCVHQNHIIRIRFLAGLPAYFNYYWNSPQGIEEVIRKAASTSGLYTLSVVKVSAIPVPLPPLDEQVAIVAQIQTQLSILNRIMTQIETSMRRASRLRQSILKRAFEGKLVPQDPNDEPASVLLERIREERRLSEGIKAKPAARKVKTRRPRGAKAS